MPLYKTNQNIIDRKQPTEVILELLSFAAGLNDKGEDHELKANEARVCNNWEARSLGGMQRTKGFNEVATGGGGYTDQLDLLIQHYESGSTRLYAVIEGDLVYKSGSSLTQDDAAAFTSGVLCDAVSAGDKLWITNATDNLKYKTIAGAITVPSSKPTNARKRIYYHQSRLIAEGGGRRIYGSRAGTGNFTAADAWSASNDAWNIDMPHETEGCVVEFPGKDVTVFDRFGAYELYNQPDVAYRYIHGSHGCANAESLARGNEGVYLASLNPTKGIFLWNGVNWIELTRYQAWIDDVDFAQRCFGIYRNGRYYFFYNESGSGVTYPNRLKIYDAEFGRWMNRPVNSDLADYFGYPALLTHSNNELYAGSSKQDSLYELETDDNSDEGNDTQATWTTKDFTSKDWRLPTGAQFPLDQCRLKLIKVTAEYYGTTGSWSILWTSKDKSNLSGTKTFSLTAEGDRINIDFVVGTSEVITAPPDTVETVSFPNKAVGRRMNFSITNNGSGTRPIIKKIKFHAIVLEEV